MAQDLAAEDAMGVIPELTEETAGIAIDKIVMLAEPINGPNSFNLETAAYGYITRDERLIIPSAYRERMPESPTDVPNLNIVEVLVIAFYNFLRLKNAGKTEDTALFLALYRARLVKLGYLMRSKENRRVTVDEVDYHEQALDHHARLLASSAEYRTEFQAATNETRRIRSFIRRAPSSAFKKFVSLVLSKPDMFQHITMVATQYAASTYLVFRQHGHHWKEDLEGKYNIMWRATTLAKPAFVPPNVDIHRVAIHSFGVYILHEKFFELFEAGQLAETYMDRSDVAPCGTAVVGTCNAAINLMRSLPIWKPLYSAYGPAIEALAKEADQLKSARAAIKFHKNAKLFGVTRVALDTSSALALAPIAKGFIKSLGETSDMAKQKTLDKRANQNPVVVQMVENVIYNVMERVEKSGDIQKALPAPMVEEVQG